MNGPSAGEREASARERLGCDVLVVGAGPAGLATAITLRAARPDLEVIVLDKTASAGGHTLSGAVVETTALDRLLPDWRARAEAAGTTVVPACEDRFSWLTYRRRIPLPTPPPMRNRGNAVVSLCGVVRLLAARAEELGVQLFFGFAAESMLYDESGRARGVRVGDLGRRRDGGPGPRFTPGVDIEAGLVVLAEGCRGSLTKTVLARFGLDRGKGPQTYGLGFKELWRVPPGRLRPGRIEHTVGWPLDGRTYGGSFLYHLDEDRLYVGFVVGLDYTDPGFSPFEAFQQFKHHPSVRSILEGGEILEAGARSLVEGGWGALPRLEAPGLVLVGDAAGTLNVPKIKGVHTALGSGILAAEHYLERGSGEGFDARFRASPLAAELRRVRNIRPGFRAGLLPGLLNAAWETATRGASPWTLRMTHEDGASLAVRGTKKTGPRFYERSLPPADRLASVYFAATRHEEDQPVHLHVADTSICLGDCRARYDHPCTRFCPAGVYEIVGEGAERRLQINAANCVHCKACDIKDPYGQITWVPPEGGSGPNYSAL
jgi:electron-transferring-flavoprotein dehydrogenase